MGIQQGSLSLCRYRLVANDPIAATAKTSIGQLNALIENYKARPVQVGGVKPGLAKEEIIGWVRPIGIDKLGQDLEAHWDLSHSAVDDGFLLRLRAERRSVPASLLQLVFKQKFQAEEHKSGKAPGPQRRKELREETKLELMGKALPNLAYVDGFWRAATGDLYVFATGKKARETFAKLFVETFANALGLTLVRLDPPLIGLPRAALVEPELASEATRLLSLTAPANITGPLMSNEQATLAHAAG